MKKTNCNSNASRTVDDANSIDMENSTLRKEIQEL